MHIIQITRRVGDRNFPYIAGIFADVAARHSAAEAIPADIRENMTLVNTDVAGYPLYIVENDGGFLYFNKDRLQSFLQGVHDALPYSKNHTAASDPWEPLLNVYVVTADYEPRTPGIDEMGLISHHHVMRDDLKPENIQGFIASLD